MRIRRLLLGALAGTQALAAQAPRVRDSAGVKIIETGARSSAPMRFELSGKPILDVGGLEDDPAKEFNHRQGYLRGVMLSNGDLAVIDVNRVHLFDAKGKRKQISGREGSGPGEFQYITAICRTQGDTLVVSDNRTRRVTVLDKNAAFVRAIPVPDGGSLPFDGCLSDGTFILERLVPRALPNGTRVYSYAIARRRLDGSIVDSLGAFESGSLDMATQREPTVFAGPTHVGFADGRGDIELLTVQPRGATIIRSSDVPVPIIDAEREERLMGTIPRGTSQDEIRQRLDRMRAMSTDKNWPAHRRIHFDDDGRMWVQDFNKDFRAAHGWTAFDTAGRILGRVMIPAASKRFEVVGFGRNQLLAAREDEDGALHLSVYDIRVVRK